MYNGRLSWHGNSGGKDLVTSSTTVNGKVCSLIKYLSPSVESELLEELQTPNDSNGRRGSLPAELILCWKWKKKFFQNFLSTRRIYHHYNILGYFVCFLWIIGTKLDPDTSRPIKKSKRKSKTLFQCFFTCIYDWMNFMAAKPSRASSYSQASIQGGGYSKCTGWDCGSSSLFGALSPLLYEHYT